MRGVVALAAVLIAGPVLAQDTAAEALRGAAAALAQAAGQLDRAADLMEAEGAVLQLRPIPDRATLRAIIERLEAGGWVERPSLYGGPPMTGAETEAFRVAVQGCWRVDPGSESSSVQVTVNFQLDRDGRVVGEVRLVRDSGGAQGAVNAAFEAARRAILRCQTPDGYHLPPDSYDQWQDVTLTFDPLEMRLR